MSERVSEPAPRRAPRIAAGVALALGLAVLLLLVAIYLARRQIAREAVTDWLRSRGVVARSSFEEIDPGRLVGSVAIGPPGAPDLTVERAEVRYSLAGLLAGKGVQVTAIRLTRPVLRARWQGGRFSAGGLDPLIAELRKRPAAPGAPSPRVQIDNALLLLATDYGPLRLSGDALIDNGRLIRLTAASAPTRLQGGGVQTDLGAAALSARLTGDQLDLRLQTPFARLDGGQAQLGGGVLTLTASLSYPNFGKPIVSRGQARAELVAQGLRAGGVTTAALHLNAAAPRLVWTHAARDGLAGDLRLMGDVHEASVSDLRLATAAGDLQGGFALGRDTSLKLTGSADARGAWTSLGAPAPGDSAQIAALKRGLRSFRASAQGLEFTAANGGLAARLNGPARLSPDSGGEVRLAPEGRGWRLTASGGGLPKVRAQARRFVLAKGAAVADGSIEAGLSIGPLQDADIRASGRLRIQGGAVSFAGAGCAQVNAARFDLGENAVLHPSARFCPDGAPLLRIGRGGFTLEGRAEAAAGAVPFLQADVSAARARVRFSDDNGRLSSELAIEAARVRDVATTERFRPLDVSGRVALAHDLWTGGLEVRLPGGARIAHAALRHDDRTGAGGVQIETGTLAFAPGGLQPEAISPVAEALGTEAEGQADFTGGFQWTTSGVASSGELRIPGLAFKSPVGRVSGLSGQVRFSSLSPLIAPAPQVLHADSIAWALPLKDANLRFGLDEKALTGSGEAAAGGGLVRIEALSVPLAANAPVHADLRLEGVQLHDLVEASPFGDRVDLDAKVSGQIPLVAEDGKVRISAGDLHAVAPGRLSIERAALSSVSAQGAVQAPGAAAGQVASTDTFTDFAYQAMENLAFNTLDAAVATRPDGRLGVIFHIVGYHDPPQHQEITVSLWDLLRRKFLGRKLPLPSGTGVDLTLDTTLNLNDLLKDYADFERLRSSPPVQR